MKSLFSIVSVWIAACTMVHSQVLADAAATLPTPAVAHIIGDLSDGSPPLVVAPSPKFIAPAEAIIETKVYIQAERKLTVRKLLPQHQAPPRKPASSPIEVITPALQQRIQETLEEAPNDELLLVSATVFRAKDGSARSFVGLSPSGGGTQNEPTTFWSSADFGYLSAFSSYQAADGQIRSLIMAWSIVEIGEVSELSQKSETEYGFPAAPEFSTGKASFVLVSGKNNLAAQRSIQSLHDLYHQDFQRLKAAHEGRERAALQHEAMLKANPPQARDIILNTWPIKTAAITEEKGASK